MAQQLNSSQESVGAAAVIPPLPLGERVQLADEIAGYLRELIITGRLRSGQALNIDALARDLKTSATPVREAMHVLRGEGFVQAEPRRGFRVAPLTSQDVEDMFLVQADIAGGLASRAARGATPELLAELTKLQAAQRAAGERADRDEMERLNYEFHQLINKAAGAPKLTWLLGVVVRYAPWILYLAIPGWNQPALIDHDAIIESIRTRDPDEARRTMIEHIQHAGALLVAHLEAQGFGDGPAPPA